MKHARFYCESISEGPVQLVGAEARHPADVLRLRAGDRAELFDGNGTLATAVISKIRKGRVSLQVERLHHEVRRKAGRIIIAAGMAKGERFDWLISKCTELGVDRISPVLFERTVKIPKASTATKRYSRLAISAAKQCGRLFLPRIDEPMPLEKCLQTLRQDCPNAQLLFGSRDNEAGPVVQFKYTGADVVAFVGPEGGLTDTEEQLLSQQGAKPVRLTETILRIETAAVAFAAILAAQRDAAGASLF